MDESCFPVSYSETYLSVCFNETFGEWVANSKGPLIDNKEVSNYVLQHRDVLSNPKFGAVYLYESDVPLVAGKPVRQIPLKGVRKVFFGRVSTKTTAASNQSASEVRVDLDSAIKTISEVHAVVFRNGKRWRKYIENRSKSLTLLNGKQVGDSNLTVGN
ncbi:MAG: FHA domain-containing protein [Chthoniobacterales bacterium]|nr:FHA domain-containing protein [Chthoniobacterales bacterium]